MTDTDTGPDAMQRAIARAKREQFERTKASMDELQAAGVRWMRALDRLIASDTSK